MCILLAASNLAWAAGAARTVILVRHAEKASGTIADVPISQAGRCRAEGIARILADSGVKQIYATEFIRAQQTAEPLAKKLGIRLETVIASKDVNGLVAKLRSGSAPGSAPGPALVVGHSNTVPEIINCLGAGAVPPIAVPPIKESEFDRLFMVTLTGPNQAVVVTLRYPGCVK